MIFSLYFIPKRVTFGGKAIFDRYMPFKSGKVSIKKSRIKLVVITNMLTPYRIPLFEAISKNQQCSLYVVVRDIISKERKAWQLGEINFRCVLVKKKEISLLSQKFDIPIGLFSLLSKLNPEVIVCGGYSTDSIISLMYAHIRRIPFYVWSGETLLSYKMRNKISISHHIRRPIIRHATGFLAYGPDAKDYLLSFKVDERKIQVIHNICNVVPFLKAQREIWGEQHPTMLYVGTLSERKNVVRLLRAFHGISRKYPNLRLKFVGDGPLSTALENYKKKFDLKNVFFIGEVPSMQVPSIMSRADFLILPSLYDQWPHVVMEAMATGLPVLCSDTSGIPNYIVKNNENGYFFHSHSTKNIIEAINKMMASRDKWIDMGQKSIAIAGKYSIEKSADLFTSAIMKSFS